MAVNSPPPAEVYDFKFMELRKIKAVKDNESLPSHALNLVVTSSRYGFVFVGLQDGFKVLKLENIMDLDEDKQKFRIPAEDYSCQQILCATPVLMSLSADDLTLAVCAVKGSHLIADMYDIRAFADPDETPMPFVNVPLSSQCTELKDFMWNPALVETYAFCLGDGSVHIHELAEMSLKVVAGLPSSTGVTSVCWSPKGKQIVLGKKDGFFSQHKPNLQEVKKIPPPQLDENRLEVLNIRWLSTTLFATVYIPSTPDADKTPSLVFVSTPKGASITYTNYGDVCFVGSSDQKPKYMMHHESEWGILICSSATSIETAILGCNSDNKAVWGQWILEGTVRAELPLDRDKETYPLGMATIYCPQRRLIISDVESYPPMPLFFLLASNGLLCPFHMLNLKKGAANLVFPSEPISRDGERRRPGQSAVAAMGNNQVPTQVIPSPPAVISVTPNNVTPGFLGSSPSLINSNQIVQDQNISRPMVPTQILQQPVTPPQLPMMNSTFSINAPEPKPPLFQNLSSTPKPTAPTQLFGMKPFTTPPISGSPFSLSFGSKPVESQVSQTPPTPVFSVATPPRPSVDASVIKSSPSSLQIGDSVQSQPEICSPGDDIHTAAVIDEIISFEKELEDLKAKTSNADVFIGTKEEMSFLKRNILLLTDFHKDLVESMQWLNLDVHALKTSSLESFSMVGEASSRQQRRNDPNYNLMLLDRALDPMSAKRMQKIHQFNQYVSTQLQELHDRVDQDISEFNEKRRTSEKELKRVQSAEVIYQTVVNNRNIIHLLKSNVQGVSNAYQKLKQKKKGQRKFYSFNENETNSTDADLSQLAETLLQIKPRTNANDKSISPQKVGRKKLSPQVQSALRDALANRRISCVRPTIIVDPSHSRLLSSTLIHTTKKQVSEAATDKDQSNSVILDGNVTLTFLSSPPLEVKPLSAFTATSGHPRVIGGITQGIPVASRNLPNFSLREINIGNVNQHSNAENIASSSSLQASSMYEDISPPSSPHQDFKISSSYSPGSNTVKIQPIQMPAESISSTNSKTAFSKTSAASFSFNADKQKILSTPSVSPAVTHIKVIDTTAKAPSQLISTNDFSAIAEGQRKSAETEVGASLQLKTPEVPISQQNVLTKVPVSVITEPNVNFTSKGPMIQGKTLQSTNTSAVPTPNKPKPKPPSSTTGSIFGSSTFSFSQKSENSPSFFPPTKFSGTAIAANSAVPVSVQTSTATSANAATSPGSTFGSTFSFSSNLGSTSPFFQPQKVESSGSVAVTSETVTTPEPSLFSESASATNTSSIFGSTPLFGQKPGVTPSFFQPANSQSSIFGKTFGQSTPVPSSSMVSTASTTSVKTSVAAPIVITQAPGKPTNSAATVISFDTSVSTSVPANSLASAVTSTVPSPMQPTPAALTSVTQPALSKVASGVFNPAVTSPFVNTPLGQKSTTVNPLNMTTISISSPTVSTSTVTTGLPTTLFSQPSVSATSGSSFSFTTVAATTATTNTASTVSFAQTGATTSSTLFGQPTATATTSAAPFSFAVTSSPATPLGQTAVATTSSIPFGQSTFTTTPASTFSFTTTASVTTASFGQTVSTTVSTAPFGQPATSTVSANPFSFTTVTTTTPAQSAFGQVTTTASTSPFGQPAVSVAPTSPFGQGTTSSIFGQTSPANSFNQSAGSPFGQQGSNAASSTFGQTGSGIFGAATPGSVFGQKDQSSNATSLFGGQSAAASGFSFGKPSGLGQNQSSSFGLAKAVFGQSQSPQSTFGQTGESSVFGQNNFFTGLGGKPNEQNASKNVFGTVAATQQSPGSTIFGSQNAATFGTKQGSFAGGSFSTGGGSVAQSGFGAFQQTPQKSVGFGGPAAFGGSPTFGAGSSPSFGAPAAFGSPNTGSPFAEPSFGSSQSSFSAFASADSPTFGSLASQTGGTYGNIVQQQQQQPQQQQQQGSLFGGGGGSLFGSNTASPPFGGQQAQPGFGSPNNGGGSSAFTQWRS